MVTLGHRYKKKIIITTFSPSCNKGEIRLAYYVI